MSSDNKNMEKQVKEANRILYDEVADQYENIDGRRSLDLENWLKIQLTKIRQKVSGGNLLDIGSGSGFVTKCSKDIFSKRISMDISPKILLAHKNNFDCGVAADVDTLPFKDNSFDAITCFAVLHHLYSFDNLISEISRILKPGGVFYSDHDMDATFNNRFGALLWIYRKFKNAKSKYINASKHITKNVYELSEFHEDGIDSVGLTKLLEGNGFSVETNFHYFGLNPFCNKVFKGKSFVQGLAPLVQIKATKLLNNIS